MAKIRETLGKTFGAITGFNTLVEFFTNILGFSPQLSPILAVGSQLTVTTGAIALFQHPWPMVVTMMAALLCLTLVSTGFVFFCMDTYRAHSSRSQFKRDAIEANIIANMMSVNADDLGKNGFFRFLKEESEKGTLVMGASNPNSSWKDRLITLDEMKKFAETSKDRDVIRFVKNWENYKAWQKN